MCTTSVKDTREELAIVLPSTDEDGVAVLVNDDGFDEDRRSRTIFVEVSAAANSCAELHKFSNHFGWKEHQRFLLRPR